MVKKQKNLHRENKSMKRKQVNKKLWRLDREYYHGLETQKHGYFKTISL